MVLVLVSERRVGTCVCVCVCVCVERRGLSARSGVVAGVCATGGRGHPRRGGIVCHDDSLQGCCEGETTGGRCGSASLPHHVANYAARVCGVRGSYRVMLADLAAVDSAPDVIAEVMLLLMGPACV